MRRRLTTKKALLRRLNRPACAGTGFGGKGRCVASVTRVDVDHAIRGTTNGDRQGRLEAVEKALQIIGLEAATDWQGGDVGVADDYAGVCVALDFGNRLR